MNIVSNREAERVRPAVAHATLVLALSASFSIAIYALIFSRLAYLPDLYLRPLLTGKQISLHIMDKGLGIVRTELIVSFVALGVLYYIGWKAAQSSHGWLNWAIVITGALGSGVALLFMYPFGAADLFDNILHARIFAFYQGNPFINLIRQYPADPFYPYTAWRLSPSAYGPLWEWTAGQAVKLAGNDILASIFVFKLLPALFWALSVAVAGIMLKRAGKRLALPSLLLFAWNPLVLYEVWGNGHNDMMMAFFILLAAWMMMEKRYTLAIVALVAGTLVKYIPVLLIPAAGLIALRALPDNRRRIRFILSSSVLSVVLTAVSFKPFWDGLQTLSIERRSEMLSGSLPSAIYSILVDGTWKLGSIETAHIISIILAILTVSWAVIMGLRAMRKPTAQSFINHSFYILMFYLLVTCGWFQQWYAIWPLVLLPFLEPAARKLVLVLGFSVLGKQLWVDPMIYWSPLWSPLPDREIAFALGNLVVVWLYAFYLTNRIWQQRKYAYLANLNRLLTLPFRFTREQLLGVLVNGREDEKR